MRALQAIPGWLVALALLLLAWFLPTGLDDIDPSASPKSAPLIPPYMGVYTTERQVVGGYWAAGALVVVGLVSLLFAARAGRWRPERPGSAHAFFAWVTILAGGVLIAFAIPIYTQQASYVEGWGSLIFLMIVGIDAVILAIGLATLQIALGDPERVSAFRAGARAFGLASLLFLGAAFRFVQ